ncbi:hypothetical protein JYK21_07310 [Ralstonia pickettii]|nr:hypothetical protein [Ralstonia pickettii]
MEISNFVLLEFVLGVASVGVGVFFGMAIKEQEYKQKTLRELNERLKIREGKGD